uniref:Sensory protein 2 n=1 Tax=Lonomia obliqua TaxID=304329 RepID=Q5MGD3_LONON|nr:sensory protein 2 [Lonomia obliqua]
MKVIQVILLLCAIVYGSMTAELTVGEFIDQVDPTPILKNKELTNKAFQCLMDKAPCGEFKLWRDMVPEVFKTKCSDCTPSQKDKFNLYVEVLKTSHPDIYHALLSKYGGKSR